MKSNEKYQVLTSEAVSEGHPDKVCDQISDAVLDECLKQDSESRVACETLATTNLVVLAGEITSKAEIDYDKLVRKVVSEIGYNDPDSGFSAQNLKVETHIHKQSSDISQGVTAETSKSGEQGAGDQGMMYGYATDETDEFMPAPILYANRIVQTFAGLRHGYPDKYGFLRPDSKSQVSFRYKNGIPVKLDSVVVSHQHTADADYDELLSLTETVVNEVIPDHYMDDLVDYYLNPTGRFVIGGPDGDTGLTGRKIIVDTYGGIGRHGGGAFSGKDPSKVDRSAAYMARYAAKNIVAAGLAKRCEIQVSYAIGIAKPLGVYVDTFGTGKVSDEKISAFLTEGILFDFRPAKIIETLDLKHPSCWNYRDTAAYGHFGRNFFPWERTDKIKEIKAMLLL